MLSVFQGARFWGTIALSAATWIVLNHSRLRRPARFCLFIVVQLALLVVAMKIPPAAIVGWFLLCLLSYLVSSNKSILPQYNHWIIWIFWVGMLVLFQQHSSLHFMVLGHSYMALRCISFAADRQTGTIKKPSFLAFIAYIFFVPSFVAGPIDRYERFVEDLSGNTALISSRALEGLSRIVVGLFKKNVLVKILSLWALSKEGWTSWPFLSSWQLWLGLYAYAWYIYLDFSGYTDIAIGTGIFFGIRLPENFQWPYFQKNLIGFWKAWHASLTSWLRDYIFIPFTQQLFRFAPLEAVPLLYAFIAYLITMLFCGFWHGTAFHYLAWGIYHGLGLWACKAYQEWSINRSKTEAFTYTWLKNWSATLLTFHFVAFGWLLFLYDIKDVPKILIKMARLIL